MARKPPYKYVPREESPEFQALVALLDGVDHAEFPARAMALVERHHDAVLAGDVSELDATHDGYEALVYVLNGNTLHGCKANENSAGHVLARAVAAVPGQVPRWGQQGEFLLEVEGMRIRVQIREGLNNHRSIELNAVDLDKPFLSHTGYRHHGVTATSHLGETVDQAVRRAVIQLIEGEGKPKSIKADAFVFTHPEPHPKWLADALAGVLPDGQLAMFGDAPPSDKPKAKSNTERQREFRRRRNQLKAEQGLKPVLLTDSERKLIEQIRDANADSSNAMPIMLTSTDRCVLSLGLLAHEDLDHRPADWAVSKKPGFDALLAKLWPEGDNGRYLAEPKRSTYRPTARLRDELERQRGRCKRLEEIIDDMRAEEEGLQRLISLEIADRAKAFDAVKVLTERLRKAGLPTDYRSQESE